MTAPQPDSSRFNNFDVLRFFGALLVFISHATFVPTGSLWADPLYALSGGQMTIGWIGVGLFFVVSGYLITQSWERRRGVLAFFRARAMRIYPALIVVVLGIFLIGGAISTSPAYFSQPGALSYLGNILVPFSDNHLPGVFEELPSSGVSDNFWTLRYEIGAYVLLALMGALQVWRRDTVLVLFLLVSLLFALGGSATNNGWFDLPRYFLAGSLVYLYRDKIRWTPGFALASLIGLALFTFTGGMKLAFSVFGTYLTLYLAFAPWLKLQRFGKYGDFSYGLYLTGLFIQQLVQRADPSLGMVANFMISFPIAMLAAVVLWYTVEKPALTFKGGKPKTRSAAPRPEYSGTYAVRRAPVNSQGYPRNSRR
ncbi:acyltransferase family protein [Deinococcus peraridilitoris]|uniref:Putative acyltransferase n=1 Tax=Deinococcus peraridilitoris (strain DSM 19664 / LMG 22246 / CIP 109416 / KR-200) TaxID=937777 RepID=L0A2R8_DEIPD|nr:acyltransferase [Deinococcus peraridilitoris]AFZ67739.1 putative acyltransferase [Deinococcus peraridilitoris DSM 19664]